MKWDQMKYIFDETLPDIVGFSEHNRVISRMSRQNRPQEVIGKWQQRTVCRFSWLRNKINTTTYEMGGTGLVTMGKGSTHTIGSGEDAQGLGRWNWVTLQGKHDKITTIISIYRPGKNQITLEKQQAHTSEKRPSVAKSVGPQELWDKELISMIKTFQEKEHEIIVAGDWNDDLNNEDGTVQGMMRSIGMKEILISRYGKGPETYHTGTKTIDGIFATPGISIQQGGYTSHEESPSDHRWLWVDIAESTLLQRNRDDHAPPVERRATSKIPSVRNKFNELLEEQVHKHDLHTKIRDLYTEGEDKGTLTKKQEKIYDLIEERMKRAVKYADKHCRKVRRGKIPFSATAQEIMRKLRILKLVELRDRLRGSQNRPHTRKLERLARKYEYTGTLTFENSDSIRQALKNAKNEYNEFKPRAHELRENHLYIIAQEKAEEDTKGRTTDWHFAKLKGEEKIKSHFKHIRKYEGKSNRVGVEKVDIVQEDGSMNTVFNKEEVAGHIRIANIEKRQQARHTPLRSEPLLSLLGEQMEYDKWEEILNGTISLPVEGIEEGTRLWYEYVTTKPTKQFDFKWTTAEYCESWNKMDETKSSIPGIHAAHMKCLQPSSDAAEILSKLALLPLLTGYAPQSWMRGIDSMIPKKTVGECRPDKLRLILLFDARFNHNNKLIGKKMMEFAEEQGILAKEQFGSRKHKSAIEHAINKRLTLDISRQNKSTCIYIANDAKSCYDRILLMVAYLAMRDAGAPLNVALSSIKTLVNMRMHIKTAHGISRCSYGGPEWRMWPHGIGQGNGYGPAIWALISSPLLKIMRLKGYGTRINSPISMEKLNMSGFSFVDDTDQCEMTMANKDWQQHMNYTQKSLTLWESLLRTTGGAIEPSKSDWTKLKYKWYRGKAKLEGADPNDKLFMRSPDGVIQELVQKEPSDARETLGVWQTATGCEEKQTKELKVKIEKWGKNIQKSGINRKETATAVKITIGKSIRYPLGATTISQKDAKSINKVFRWASLGKMKVVRTAPALMTTSPVKFGGLGMDNDVYDNQVIDHTLALLSHGHTKTTTGTLLRISFEALAIEAGIGGDPGSFDVRNMTWITSNTWVGSTLLAYNKYNLELETSMTGLKTWNTRDDYIMEKAYDAIKGIDIILFNKVRLYLRVSTVSDISTANGREIDHNILRGKRSMSPTLSEYAYTWPNIPEPTPREIEIWYNTLSILFSITVNNPRLPEESDFKWDKCELKYAKWTTSLNGKYVYERQQKHWTRWKKETNVHRRRQSTLYAIKDTVETIDDRIRPVTVARIKDDHIIITHKGKTTSFEDSDQEKHAIGWMLPLLETTQQAERIFGQQIIQGRGILVSDGSYKNHRSSAAFTTVPDKVIKGSLTIPGNKHDQSSYRAELGGILSAIVFANSISKKFDILEGKCTMICDNKGALSASFGHKHINPRWQCYDILCMIRYHLANSPIKWKSKHVKGHQDRTTLYKDLDVVSQANVDVDELAKIELQRFRDIDEDQVLEGQCWQVKNMMNEDRIQGNVESSLRRIFYEEGMINYWKKKFGLPRDITPQEWDLMCKVHTSRSEWEHLFSVKLASGILPTKANMVMRKHGEDPSCPSCECEETTNHLLQCQSIEQKKTYAIEIDSFTNYLRNNTSWEIRGAILELIQAFRDQRDLIIHSNWGDNIVDTITEQFELGQRAFIGGMWVEGWITAQKVHHTTLKTRTHGTTVIAQMIIQVQKILRELWYSRNESLHENEHSRINKEKSRAYNIKIDTLYERKEKIHSRLLAQADRKYFCRNKQTLKQLRMTRKVRWVHDAEAILDKYDNENESEQVRTFRAYFMHRDDG